MLFSATEVEAKIKCTYPCRACFRFSASEMAPVNHVLYRLRKRIWMLGHFCRNSSEESHYNQTIWERILVVHF